MIHQPFNETNREHVLFIHLLFIHLLFIHLLFIHLPFTICPTYCLFLIVFSSIGGIQGSPETN